MKGENGQSRGFGFVSYQQPEQAAHALHTMNGQTFGGKQIQVRFHEPKQLRQEKLAQRFAEGGMRRTSGSTSPALSENDGTRVTERPRRGSGSYFNVCSQHSTILAAVTYLK